VRFDYDPSAAGILHPAAHMTINGSDCRIACVAPLHPYRFLDFIFRNFYPELWSTQQTWFDTASRLNIGERVLTVPESEALHLMWRAH
jgi:hypothetical protein